MTTAPLLQTNLNALSERNPDWARVLQNHIVDTERFVVEPTRDDCLTVQCQSFNGDRKVRTYLHSRYAPQTEAERFADTQMAADNLVLYGFGLGYHVQAMFERLQSRQTLHVVEANLDVLKVAFEFFSFEEMLLSPDFTLQICPNPEECVAVIDAFLEASRRVVVHRPSVQSLGDSYADLKLLLTNIVLPGNDEKRQEYARINHFTNMQRRSAPVSDLWGRHTGCVAMVISSGPSLEDNVTIVRHWQAHHRVISICAGSAYRFLRTHEIEPTYVVLLDAVPEVRSQFEGCEEGTSRLLYANFSSHTAVSAYRGQKYVYFCEPFPGVNEENILSVGGSVANAAVAAAIRMGVETIVFVGQDLCFIENRHHAPGTFVGKSALVPELPNFKRVKNVQGEYVSTQPNLLNYRKWFENTIAEHSEISFFNLTTQGLPIAGAPLVSAAELRQIIDGLT